MSIIVSKNGMNAQKIEESHFGLEDRLQEHVKNNPDIVPIYEIKEDARLLVLAREFGTNSGPIDALGVDQDGNIYVIETKLYKNPDKRIVLAQALDYGASLWRHSGDSTEFIEMLSRKVEDQFGVSLLAKVQDFFEIEEGQYLIDAIAKNVLNGSIKFVILMDKVEDRLKDLITYVNQNSRFDIYAVDLQYYKHDEFEIIIPKLYGAEVRKEVASDTDDLRFDNQKIIQWIRELDADFIFLDSNYVTKTYVRFTTKYFNELLPPRDDTKSGWGNGNAYNYEIRTDRSGWVKIQLVLNSTGVNDAQQAMQERLIRLVNRKPKKPDWTWFTIEGWKVDFKNGDSALRSDIERVLMEHIPKFERDLHKLLSNSENA